jgi:hypothetical protein
MTIMPNAEPVTTRKLPGRTRQAVTHNSKIKSRKRELIPARARGRQVREEHHA